MATTFVQTGAALHYIVPAGRTIKSGDLVAVNDVVGVAQTDGKAGDLIAIATREVYRVPLPEIVGDVAQGKAVYFNPTTNEITLNPAGAIPAGHAWEAGVAGQTVNIRLL